MNLSVKIKDNDQLLDANIELADGVMIVSPVVKREEEKPKFEPKDGDVIVCTGVCGTYTALYKCYTDYGAGFYVILYPYRKPEFNSTAFYLEARPATEEEKKEFFDILEKHGYRWNAEKMELEEIKWKPKLGRKYYAPCLCNFQFAAIEDIFEGCSIDYKAVEKGWAFQSKEECQQLCDKLNQAINSVNQ